MVKDCLVHTFNGDLSYTMCSGESSCIASCVHHCIQCLCVLQFLECEKCVSPVTCYIP